LRGTHRAAPEALVNDLVYLALSAAFFAATWGFVRLTERV
jgi:hypothetical protein